MGIEEHDGLSIEDAKAMLDGKVPVGTKVSEDVMILAGDILPSGYLVTL